MKHRPYLLGAAVVALCLAIAGGALYLTHRPPSVDASSLPSPAAPPLSATAPAPTATPPASAPAIQHPIESITAEAAASAPGDNATLEDHLSALFGRKPVLSLLQLDDFASRLVATVDNLARAEAASRLWPVSPANGRFIVQRIKGEEVMSPDNGLRYTPYVVMLERVDLRQMAALYKRLYPRLQAAYEELGYPKAYFNDRVVAVIDHLLAAPEPTGLLPVHLAEVKGPVQPARPWVMYEFDDPALQAASAGHKIMLRMGPVNERRVKARLRELRPLIATAAPTGG
jgi:hypothetical protein